jgi:predicted phosphodiesterase
MDGIGVALMTKLAILSDIHGNLPALEAVLADLAADRVDRIVVAGDLVNWGPFSAQVVERAIRDGWVVIRGNNEYYLLDHGTPRAPAAWSDQHRYPLLPWLQRQFSPALKAVVATWPDTLSLRFPDGPPLRVVHGTPRSPWEALYPDAPDGELGAALTGITEPIVVAGHTHLAMDRQVDQWRALTPGSVGVPLDGGFDASYLILKSVGEEWQPTFRCVAYDRQPLFEEFDRQSFRERCGVVGELVLEEFRTARVRVHPFAIWRNACYPDRAVTDELLQEFRQVDWRRYAPSAYHP